MNPLDWVIAFMIIMVGEAFIKPLAVKVFDLIVLPQLSSVFAKHINKQAGEWLQSKTKAEMQTALIEAISKEINGFSKRPKFLQDLAVKRLDNLYSLLKNAEKENG